MDDAARSLAFVSLERKKVLQLFALLELLVLAACSTSSGDAGVRPAPATLSAAAELGEHIFHDSALSASARMSCATCHDPDSALAARPGSGPVPLGGPGLDVPGFRNAPSLRYVALTPSFFFDDEGTPTGGFDRDGRADSLAAQARRPFLAAHEMANASPADVVAKLAQAPYADDFRALFGEDILASPDVAFDRMLFAIQQYEREDTEEFAPFTSKFDAFLAGRVQFSAQELRGYSLFNDPTLRNIAVTAPYFHNGEFATLRAALEFYVQRDTNPEKFYPLDAGGQAQKFNDLPDQYKANVNTTEVPYNRHAGDVPALGDSDIDDVIAFLNTLTDGLQP